MIKMEKDELALLARTLMRQAADCNSATADLIHNSRRTREYCDAQALLLLEAQTQAAAVESAMQEIDNQKDAMEQILRAEQVSTIQQQENLKQETEILKQELQGHKAQADVLHAEKKILLADKEQLQRAHDRLTKEHQEIKDAAEAVKAEYETRLEEKEEEVTKLEEQLVLLLVRK
jgi:predicted  nucleic acid-binding Zn-ribbon protein